MVRLMKAEKEHAKCAADLLMKLWPGHTEEEMLECAMEYIGEAKKAAFLAREEGAFCGICLVSLRHDYVEGCETSPVGYLEGVFVREEFRRRGIATELVRAGEAWARSLGCSEFASDCELENVDSLRFHLGIGFIEMGRNIHFSKQI